MQQNQVVQVHMNVMDENQKYSEMIGLSTLKLYLMKNVFFWEFIQKYKCSWIVWKVVFWKM